MLPYLVLTTVFSSQTSDMTIKEEVDIFLCKNLVLQKPNKPTANSDSVFYTATLQNLKGVRI
jgi:hypothetical protein